MASTQCECCNILNWDYIPKKYKNDTNPDKRKAGGIMIYKGRVLIVQSRAKKWGFPKGGFEKGENASMCAKREIYEETSLKVIFNEDDSKIKFKHTTFFIKHFQIEPPDIDYDHLKTPGNDCTGIGWIRLTCLRQLVNKANEETNLVDEFENMTLEHEPMRFNLGLRKFVQKYCTKPNPPNPNPNPKQTEHKDNPNPYPKHSQILIFAHAILSS